MLRSNKIDLLSITQSLNTLLVGGFIAAMLVNIILAAIVWQSYFNKSRTLVPPVISKAFTVSDGQVDEPYLRQMAEYFALLKLNVTPASVDHQYPQLSQYLCEDSWHVMQPLLSSDADMIKRQNISSHFTLNRTQVALDEQLIKLTGVLSKYVGKRALEPETVSYVIATRYDHGQLCLLTMKKSLKEVT
ncbi:type IV conjugative transfer system protein TraE [Shewanella psychropiezotolerans]|uniref:Type IV conjugative transfer system protein TraE n=1 Tax=Shewanella psychropiezotolerans TaxID=2593655 RepID=A0ABX5X583_9GAMM|nr:MULTISPECIES: type IV conjugative transfer system protein TraE [Shewanella]MPY24497.1 type IV conjugative transfer system protein TraE [Shewanella sp. YLB-07]QDO86517.1 type IV conjugative transfer system protein TraE [Shewanella psychropiezotolerans]